MGGLPVELTMEKQILDEVYLGHKLKARRLLEQLSYRTESADVVLSSRVGGR